MQDIEIREIKTGDWQSFKDLRLEALKESPLAFAFDFEEESVFSEKDWKDRIKNTYYLGAFLNDKLTAMMGAKFFKGNRVSHLSEIVGVYVLKDYRRQNIAKKLLNRIILDLKEKQIEKVKLWVNAVQNDAFKFYQNYGFVLYGKSEKELYVDGKYYDELLMEMMI